MDQDLLNFLSKERVCALTVLLNDGQPHSAALHFSHNVGSEFEIYFSTERSSRKCEPLLGGKISKASIVVGFSEVDWKTIQLEGEVYIAEDKDELDSIKAIHYAKHPQSKKYENDPETVFLVFKSKQYKYSDLSQRPPKIVKNS